MSRYLRLFAHSAAIVAVVLSLASLEASAGCSGGSCAPALADRPLLGAPVRFVAARRERVEARRAARRGG